MTPLSETIWQTAAHPLVRAFSVNDTVHGIKMKMQRVKYTRREYRDEYLRSEEWMKLRSKVISERTVCAKCKVRPATQVHHTRYRNIVNVHPHDLLPLCNECHELVHVALDIGLLPDNHSRQMALEIRAETVENRLKYRRNKIQIPLDLLHEIVALPPDGKKFVCGILKRLPPSDFLQWQGLMVTGKQFDQIRWTVRKFRDGGSFQESPHLRSISFRKRAHHTRSVQRTGGR